MHNATLSSTSDEPCFWAPEEKLDSFEMQVKLQKRLRNLKKEEIRRIMENPVTKKYIKLPDYSVGEATLVNILGLKTQNHYAQL